jgi:hypothetical protein
MKIHFLFVQSDKGTGQFDRLSILWVDKSYEPRHDKTNVMRLRPAWILTSLRIRTIGISYRIILARSMKTVKLKVSI